MRILNAFVCGLVFGLGLILSGMANPAKVLAFLDLAGHWDPSLAFVMAGAVVLAALGFRLARSRGTPCAPSTAARSGIASSGENSITVCISRSPAARQGRNGGTRRSCDPPAPRERHHPGETARHRR